MRRKANDSREREVVYTLHYLFYINLSIYWYIHRQFLLSFSLRCHWWHSLTTRRLSKNEDIMQVEKKRCRRVLSMRSGIISTRTYLLYFHAYINSHDFLASLTDHLISDLFSFSLHRTIRCSQFDYASSVSLRIHTPITASHILVAKVLFGLLEEDSSTKVATRART